VEVGQAVMPYLRPLALAAALYQSLRLENPLIRISNIRRASANAYHHLHQGLSTAAAVVEKSAHLYSLTRPVLQHVLDTREVDAALLQAYGRLHTARSFAGQIDQALNG